MYVDLPDLSGLAAIYSVLFLLAFLWWWFNTDSKYKLLEVCFSLSLIGAIFVVAGGTMLVIEMMGPFTFAETLLIVGTIISIVSWTGWHLLRKEAQ